MMKRLIAGAVFSLLAACPVLAADISNGDAERQSITVMEAGRTYQRMLDPGEHADICPNGCMVVFPDGSEKALSGAETIEIRNGAGHLD
jgi:hypothetical protein